MEEDHWHVITTRPRAEKSVGSQLNLLGIYNYVPLQKQLRQWHDRKKWVELPLFPSYVFVRLTGRQRFKVFDAAGVIKYVQSGKDIAKLSEEEVERIKRLCIFKGDVQIKAGQVSVGGEICIEEGHFKGMKGIISGIGNNQKLKILLNGLNCYAVIENYNIINS